jgi:hypothetical protein
MIKKNRSILASSSSNSVSSSAAKEINGHYIHQWQTSRSHHSSEGCPKIGMRVDNRRWSSSPKNMNAVSAYEYKINFAAAFGYRDPLKAVCERGVKVPQPDKARTYLFRYPELSKSLDCATKLALQAFGPQIQLSLEVYRDPETSDEYLTLYLRQSKYDPEIMKKIKQIRRTSRSLIKEYGGRFLLTTDFHPPR